MVALEEVWTDGAKDEFINKLGPSYKFHATQLWGHQTGGGQDSGLMLFSRFTPIDNPYVPKVTKTIGFGTIGYDYNRLWDPNGNPMAAPPEGADFGFYSCIDPTSLDATGPEGGGGPWGVDWIHMEMVSPAFTGCSLAFHLFPRLASDDSYSDKGIGYVRLQNSRTNRPLNLFFTHNQAIYWDSSSKPFHQHAADVEEELDSNLQAFTEEAAFMNLFVPRDNIDTSDEDTIAIGDHNVPGDTPYYDWASTDPTYGMTIAGARDTFRVDQSPSGEDPGFTWDSRNSAVPPNDLEGNDRLDYVFDRPGTRAPDCALQLRNMQDWKVTPADIPGGGDPAAAGTDLSDHYPLEVTLGALAQRCSPARALVNPLPANQPDVDVPGQISYSGGYQWYRFDGSDTLKVHISAPTTMSITAYTTDDLTNPIEPDLGFPASPPNAPRTLNVTYSNPGSAKGIYLRVKAIDELWTGVYSLHVHRAAGSTMADAITLHDDRAGKFSVATFAQGIAPGTEQIKTYFHFKTEQLWSGNRQKMAFRITQLNSLDPHNISKAPTNLDGYWMQVIDSNNNIVSATPNWIDKYQATWSGTMVPAAEGDYYLGVYRRYSPVHRPTAYIKATWTTDLRTIDLESLKWMDDSDSDDTQVLAWIDHDPVPYHYQLGSFDELETKGFPAPSAVGNWNPAPIDASHINIADTIELLRTDADGSNPALFSEFVPAQGKLGQSQLGVYANWLVLKYARS